MASLSGSFTGPAATASVPYAAGGSVTFTLQGVWPRALVNAEASQDGGATWAAIGVDYGADGAALTPITDRTLTFGTSGRGAGAYGLQPPGAGLFRLRCVEFRSGYLTWTISA